MLLEPLGSNTIFPHPVRLETIQIHIILKQDVQLSILIGTFLTSSLKLNRSALEGGFERIEYSVTSGSCNGSWAGGVLYREYKILLISVLSAPLCSTFLRELWTFRTLVGSYQSFCVHLSRGGLGTPHWGVSKVTSTQLGGIYDHFYCYSDTWECCMGWFEVTLWF